MDYVHNTVKHKTVLTNCQVNILLRVPTQLQK